MLLTLNQTKSLNWANRSCNKVARSLANLAFMFKDKLLGCCFLHFSSCFPHFFRNFFFMFRIDHFRSQKRSIYNFTFRKGKRECRKQLGNAGRNTYFSDVLTAIFPCWIIWANFAVFMESLKPTFFFFFAEYNIGRQLSFSPMNPIRASHHLQCRVLLLQLFSIPTHTSNKRIHSLMHGLIY